MAQVQAMHVEMQAQLNKLAKGKSIEEHHDWKDAMKFVERDVILVGVKLPALSKRYSVGLTVKTFLIMKKLLKISINLDDAIENEGKEGKVVKATPPSSRFPRKGKYASAPGFAGGWAPISDLKNPEIVMFGKFAISEYNTKANTTLEFNSLVEGEFQVISGVRYSLVIDVKDGGVVGKYQAIVWDEPWEKLPELTSFTKL
ncbi:cystatin-1-like [Impatiens glandulifera]|uniref:cystatin-1-like n=1 Tax=Impatiens glandulifera TaxID=253017 RepID=UPI001FB18E56|nr:cystatin-1-like [Impatiens glandulifera]